MMGEQGGGIVPDPSTYKGIIIALCAVIVFLVGVITKLGLMIRSADREKFELLMRLTKKGDTDKRKEGDS